jgi:hypothetical protein
MKMKYSVRYMDVKHRPMYKYTQKHELPLLLAKVAFWTVSSYVVLVAFWFFIQNVTYWGR